MKRILFMLLILPFTAFAQVRTHTVQAKENFSSIGRLYDINGRVLAEYNNLKYEGGLSIGQVLNIPASANSVPAKVTAPKIEEVKITSASGSPFYHTVGKKETLYHISTLYPGATVAKIKDWNKLTSVGLNEGQVLIVGFGNEKQVVKETIIKETTVPQKEVVKEPDPVAKNNVPKKQPDVVVPVYNENRDQAGNKIVSGGLVSTTGGFFKNDFENNNQKELNGEAGIFKSTSGWDDEKYYCLYNDARPGTVIKVTNPATNKFIFAKVLDVIPDLKENGKVILRLSNSAADVLGVSGSSFECKINY